MVGGPHRVTPLISRLYTADSILPPSAPCLRAVRTAVGAVYVLFGPPSVLCLCCLDRHRRCVCAFWAAVGAVSLLFGPRPPLFRILGRSRCCCSGRVIQSAKAALTWTHASFDETRRINTLFLPQRRAGRSSIYMYYTHHSHRTFAVNCSAIGILTSTTLQLANNRWWKRNYEWY